MDSDTDPGFDQFRLAASTATLDDER
ncbi:MAG: hypothetical protein A07HB70_00164, partial [uncultured archaeon A07HB70]